MAQYMADVGKTAASVAGCGQCHADNECAIDGSTDAADAGAQ
jgi:hypothetical protein